MPPVRVALVTGPSSGIGRATAVLLAAAGFHVVAAGRSPERVGAVVDRIVADGGSAEFLPLDLASLGTVRAAAERVIDSRWTLDILVNNAGVGMTRGVSADGFEIHWSVNHLGHFLLTDALGPALATGSRVVTVSSEWHRRARQLHLDRVRVPGRSPFGLAFYATTKTANILFTRELARRRPDLHTYAVHPGLAATGIYPGWVRPLMGRMPTPEQAADTVVWCALSDQVATATAGYYADRQERRPSALASDDALAAELWERSEGWTRE